jgi:hypothetical protein
MSGFEDNGSIAALEQEILGRVGELKNDTPRQLAALVSNLQAKLNAGDFKNRTGDLRRSMRVALLDNNISISMKNYGYYLSFGVKGRNRNNTLGLPPEVATAFGVKEGYRFGSDKVWGISARKFYPLDVEEQLLDILIGQTDL